MSIDRIYQCDWRECETHARAASNRPPTAFITVAEDAGRSTQHFCTWDCLLKFAGEKPPVEVVPWDDAAG
jgi:hypothetical protein